jgi:hypothetical protein
VDSPALPNPRVRKKLRRDCDMKPSLDGFSSGLGQPGPRPVASAVVLPLEHRSLLEIGA